MATFLALYQGTTPGDAQVLHVSTDLDLIQVVGQRMPTSLNKPDPDPVRLQINEGRRKAILTLLGQIAKEGSHQSPQTKTIRQSNPRKRCIGSHTASRCSVFPVHKSGAQMPRTDAGTEKRSSERPIEAMQAPSARWDALSMYLRRAGALLTAVPSAVTTRRNTHNPTNDSTASAMLGQSSAAPAILIIGELTMVYNIQIGQAGVVGNGNNIADNAITLTQSQSEGLDTIDLLKAAAALFDIRSAIRSDPDTTPEHDLVAANLVVAAQAAKVGDRPTFKMRLVEALKIAGEFSLKIGENLLTAEIKKNLGFPSGA